jgi:acetyl-CoA C-acetyltransferase
MVKRVAIVGAATVPVGKSPIPSWQLFAKPALAAIKDAELDPKQVQALHVGNVYSDFTENQTNIAPLVLSTLGLGNDVECVRYETACASSSVAFRQGYLGILSGLHDVVLVGGTERLRAISSSAIQEAMATSLDLSERNAGLTFAVYWAYVAKSYARKHGIDEEHLQRLLAEISVKNHYHGAANPSAQLRKETTVEEVLASPTVASPIKVMDCCPFSDGAAALLLASEEVAKHCPKPIWIAGSGQGSGLFTVADRCDLSGSPAIVKAANEAYRQAGIGPEHVDVAEVHDCVNIHEVMCLESAGLFKNGEAISSAADKRTYSDGELPVNVSGGLKSRGHPVGATGAYQLCELTQLLRGEFQGRNINHSQTGLTVNVGGTGTVATVHILRRDK